MSDTENRLQGIPESDDGQWSIWLVAEIAQFLSPEVMLKQIPHRCGGQKVFIILNGLSIIKYKLPIITVGKAHNSYSEHCNAGYQLAEKI